MRNLSLEGEAHGGPVREAGVRDRTIPVVAQGLHKRYGPVLAVDDVSLEVHAGEILGLLGPNGAGKSTVLRMLTGFQYPDAGRVLLQGHDVFQEGPRARARLGYLPEAVPLYADMEVRRYLEFFARIKGAAPIRERVDSVIERLDLSRVLGRPCGNVSRGYRQRIGLAQALLQDPAILILDEPTSGLDPNQIKDFRTLLRDLGRDRAILLSTHILSEAMEVCDRVLILNRGRAVASGRPGELMGEGVSLHWARLRLPARATPEESARFALEPEFDEAVPGAGPYGYRVRRDLPREEARHLLRTALDRNWEVLEWGSGAAGLEALFRRLTLGEGDS